MELKEESLGQETHIAFKHVPTVITSWMSK